MNILITGCDGFLGKELTFYFKNKKKYNLLPTNKKQLNVASLKDVNNFFKKNKVDIVLHAAFIGARNPRQLNLEDHVKNFSMFLNLRENMHNYKLLINFCSGAAYERGLIIDNILEDEIFNRCPRDLYGSAKNLIARNIVEMNKNLVNFRLFGCFGAHELESRLIKSSIFSYLKKEPAIIHQDREMDYFYAQDVGNAAEHYIKYFSRNNLPNDVNLCYGGKKRLLSQVVKMIYELNNVKNDVIIEKPGLNKAYTGDSTRLSNLNIALEGLESGIKNVFQGVVTND